MSDEQSYSQGEADRRSANVLRFGTIAEIDHANATVKVDLGELTTDWIPWTTPRAGQDQVWSTPDVGEQVVVLSAGEPSQGVVMGSIFQNSHPANGNAGKDRRITFKDGTVVEFDRDGSVLNLTMAAAGQFNVTISGAKIEASASSVKFTVGGVVMNITSAGVAITGGTVTHNGKNVGSTHTHGGIQPGGASTAAPN